MLYIGLIKDSEFLTKRSSERLRITLTSTIQLVEYLLNDCAFSTYISINIYFIFKFFGIIRQVQDLMTIT
ncbi:Uncharacterized protein FWK35_00006299 [Aphis craccivora]|uniref:Uncharacterized protein n=1 Tax=Aphis craccivora TaxID=307492 RepID=A0A6G0ZQA5_APHCR|nr:Uncharacterized protein FWK35_00006299 [Aphis craccivora]